MPASSALFSWLWPMLDSQFVTQVGEIEESHEDSLLTKSEICGFSIAARNCSENEIRLARKDMPPGAG